MREIRLIDRGGYGVVHEVDDLRGRRLARKSFDPQIQNPDEREKLKKRFAREVRIQSQIRHPNIMPIIEQDLDASPPWFTMPLATQSFLQKLATDRALDTFDPTPWQDILAAVEELHRLGYVHRDLKPANVLLVRDTWMLSDFGLILPIARDTTILTSSRSAYGSHNYAAPEQAQDFRNTPEQADVFALGCILHDAVDPTAVRVPFAQIRAAGLYGPLLEKCTEVDVKKRIPTIASLRSALFDLWRTSQFSPPTHDDATVLEAVIANPDSVDSWRTLVGHLEQSSFGDRGPVLRAINGATIVRLAAADDVLFSRFMHVLCAWVEGTAFDWAYCDVVGDRLLDAYRVSTTRIRCQVVIAALELAISHNRWHVMGQVGAMLGPTAENGLIDRLLIEISMEPRLEEKLRRIEQVIPWRRERWHPKIAEFLTGRDVENQEGA